MNAQRMTNRRVKKVKGHKCTDCANAKFDEQWGEYKCLARCIRISNPNSHWSGTYTGCKLWTAKKKGEEK